MFDTDTTTATAPILPPKTRHRRARRKTFDPEKVAAALTAGPAIKAMARASGLSRQTIRKLLASDSPDWQAVKAAAAKVTFDLASRSLDHASDRLPDASYRDAVIGAAVLLDKSAQLRGDAGASVTLQGRIQHQHLHAHTMLTGATSISLATAALAVIQNADILPDVKQD